ncbi:MAG: protein kinase, partial [Chitinivibrionales bacterium]|nr:protein kinase [Chitinivibrionales bacterium]MBD3395455.1 protein kinase [Chitinivibrionales bacterium]
MALFKGSRRDDPLEPLRADSDRYRILGFLGKGRLADVSTAFDGRLGRMVAAKYLRKENLDKPENVRSFLNEAKLISYLDHPGVVSIYDAFIGENDEPCYTMRLIEGHNLAWDLKSKTRGQLLHICTKLCETLAYVHDKGVVHLDLNPNNVLLGSHGQVMITDWGNARLYEPKAYHEYLKLVRDAPPPPLDEDAHPKMGTPQYMSPEQTRGEREALTPSSDIFSLGVILYLTMTGTLPFSGSDREALFEQIRTYDPPLLHEASPDIPVRLSHICARMLKKDPFERYHNFHQVLQDLDRFHNSGEAFQLVRYNKGDVVFREGDAGDFALCVVEGSVEVLREIEGRQKVIATMGKDEIVGELAIFTGEKRTGTVRAVQDGTIIRVMGRQA